MAEVLRKIDRAIHKVLLFVANISLVAMVLILTYTVVLRWPLRSIVASCRPWLSKTTLVLMQRLAKWTVKKCVDVQFVFLKLNRKKIVLVAHVAKVALVVAAVDAVLVVKVAAEAFVVAMAVVTAVAVTAAAEITNF